MSFKIGDRVVLINRPYITPTRDWPAWGSEYGCAGTVTWTQSIKVEVGWDNGATYVFAETSLEHVLLQGGTIDTKLPKTNPNQVFRRRKRDRGRDEWEPEMTKEEYFRSKKMKEPASTGLKIGGLTYQEWKKQSEIDR